jgi:hypothetical protein
VIAVLRIRIHRGNVELMDAGDHDAAEQGPLGGPSLESLAKSHPMLVTEFRDLEPVGTAASFSGLLTAPQLQANCYRLEYLVHLALAYCEGDSHPNQALVQRSFKILGDGFCGMAEDPAEDVFVALVNTPRGNFRVFEGIREGNSFHLQRILNVVESMPPKPPFKGVQEAVEALLKISDAVAERAGLTQGTLGQEMPLRAVPKGLLHQVSSRRRLIQFSRSDLEHLRVAQPLLSAFEFRPGLRDAIMSQSPGHTEIERRPVLIDGDIAYLLLPTAVGSAITRLVIDSVLSMGLGTAFERALADDFAKLLGNAPLLGGRSGAPIQFRQISHGRAASIIREVDPGRFLQLVLLVDGLDGFQESGLIGHNPDPEGWGTVFREYMVQAAATTSGQPGFRGGVSLLVACGFGRAALCGYRAELPKAWRAESVPAHDLVTLSWLSEFNALSLWRLLDAQEAVKREGVALVNVNGLLNLLAWSRHLHGHLVPHGQLSDLASSQVPTMIVIQQNMLRNLRHEAMLERSPRRVPDVNGRWVKAIKLDKTYFEEESRLPLYGSEEDLLRGELRGVYLAPNRPWWLEIGAPPGTPIDSIFEHWKMLCMWIGRAAPVLDKAYSNLPPGPIQFHVAFKELAGTARGFIAAKGENELRMLLTVSAQPGDPRVWIDVAPGYQDGFSQPENVAERLLVEAMVVGASQVAGEASDLAKCGGLVSEICPNSEARGIHRFEARHFRDYVHSELDRAPVLIDEMDDATYRLGLGWRVRSRDNNTELSDPKACTSLLNDVVQVVLNDICEALHGLDRRSFVMKVLLNHERAALDRDHWNRTTQAILALHNDKEAAARAIVDRHGRLNGCCTACRILLEAAVCECPLSGGAIPGELDLSRLMALAMLAYYLGGWSDAIHWGAAAPRVKITALGDVHMDHTFMDAIYEPFGRSYAETDINRALKSYAALYNSGKAHVSAADAFEFRFLDAWTAEFGIPLDGILAFVQALEEACLEPPKAVSELRRSALAGTLATAAEIPYQTALDTLALFTLAAKPGWRTSSPPFADKDWYPWRFRRRLSVLRRPFLEVDSAEDPVIAFAPGLVGESFRAIVTRFESGEILPSQAVSSAMQQWIGHANNVQRTEFNSSVAARMEELGWRVKKEITLTGLLGHPLDRNYGDIDVLAWRPEVGRVMAIECKDVQFNKTLGEVAEQLADFRGEIRPDGKPDHLKRHLNRLHVLETHSALVAKKLKLSSPVKLEGHLVFRNPVPMRFAWERMASKVRLSLFSELDRL